MKTILVLHTGGTISMSKVAGGSVAPNEKNPLMEQEALFSGKVHLVVEDIFNIPSPHMTLERMFQLKERIQKAYSEPWRGYYAWNRYIRRNCLFFRYNLREKNPHCFNRSNAVK